MSAKITYQRRANGGYYVTPAGADRNVGRVINRDDPTTRIGTRQLWAAVAIGGRSAGLFLTRREAAERLVEIAEERTP
jgi:hypothetical protein